MQVLCATGMVRHNAERDNTKEGRLRNLLVRDVDATIRFLQTAFPDFRIRFDASMVSEPPKPWNSDFVLSEAAPINP